jgi:hypothetical protein
MTNIDDLVAKMNERAQLMEEAILSHLAPGLPVFNFEFN